MSLILGLDIGGTKSAAVLGDETGRVLAREAGPTPQGPWPEAVAFMIGLLHTVRPAHAQITALGVSCGGPLDSRTGVIHTPPNLPHWTDVPLRDLLQNEFQLPVWVENDANATALAEHQWGAGKGTRDMAFLTMGTGIGAGLILDNQLYRGRRDLAGEIGHATILPNGPPCLCGKFGCLETLASGTAIGRIGRERYHDSALTAHDICARARLQDPLALEIIHDAALHMGIGLANLLQTLNLERIVLGTLAVQAGDLLLEPIRKSAQDHCWPRVWKGVSILPAALGNAAQDMAALAVARFAQ